MKKTIYFLLVLLASLTYSCSSDDDSNQEEQNSSISYNLDISGKYTNEWCGVENNTSKIKFSFIEDGNIESSVIGESSVQLESGAFSEDLSGNIIGVKLELLDYDPDNLTEGSYGDGFESLSLRITNNSDETILIDEDIYGYYLVHCTDVAYEVMILYNIDTDELTITSETDGF